MSDDSPPLLTTIVHRPDAAFDSKTGKHVVGLSGLCAGYEDGTWRCGGLAEHLIEVWLPEFALRHSELTNVGPRTMGRLMRRAARSVYTTKKFKRRGEFGELLLHAILAQEIGTVPAVSKIYYKDGSNDTVKGFDAVHVVPTSDGLELWLGEAKFYANAGAAIRSAVKSLGQINNRDYLKDEFAAIVHKIDDQWPHAAKLRRLLDRNTSLDKIFAAACIPVLLTYDSSVTASHAVHDAQYEAEIAEEWETHFKNFAQQPLPAKVKVHLFLVPLNTKKLLVKALDKELRKWQ
jgi:hypothetical protein